VSGLVEYLFNELKSRGGFLRSKGSKTPDVLTAGNLGSNIEGTESKYFADSLKGARSYADQALEAFGDVLTVVQTRIPVSAITLEMRVTVDRGINAVVVPTSKLQQLAPAKVVP
jgi:hypothetical protein